jgi:hypothetical protein
MGITWTIAIDWNRDGSFTGANEDVTSRVIDAKWFLLAQKPYQEQADNSLLTLGAGQCQKSDLSEPSALPSGAYSILRRRNYTYPLDWLD